ncbi:MAG: histidine kinase N-terminal 7TM domain-containing protein, partial [Thermodesulfobacteriota bacterium]
MFFLSLIAAIFSFSQAVFILSKDWRVLNHRIFAVGMIVLALEAASDIVSLTAPRIEVMLRWQYIKMAATAFLPGVWLVFTLMLENEDYKKSLTKWKGILLPLFIIPIMLLIFFNESFVIKKITFSGISKSSLFLSWPGKLFHIFLLLSSAFILVFLEKILRTTSGTMRWQIKFLILGIGAIFTMRVYTSSQALLYSIIDDSINILNSFAIIGGNTLIAISFIRTSKLNLTVYPSQTFLYNSLMLMIIGAYLIGVGLLAKLIHHFGYTGAIPLNALFIFFAILFLAAFILSEKVRQKIKESISRHLLRHHYDYREQWREFTRRTSSLIDIGELSYVISKMIAETLGVSTASVWLSDENKGSFILGGSTAYSSKEKHFLKLPEKQSSNFPLEIKNHAYLIDFQKPKELWQEELKKANNYYFQGNRIRYAIPIILNENILGLITVNEKVTKREFSIEDFDLLRTISEQVASTLLNLKLSEQIRNFKE